jgi:hypothetical protein
VDHAGLVGGLDAGGDLHGQLDGLVRRDRTAIEAVGQRPALHVLEDEFAGAVLLLPAVDAGEVGVVELGERAGLAFEAFQAGRVRGELRREGVDRDGAVQPRVGGEIHHAHAAATEFAGDSRGADLVDHGGGLSGFGGASGEWRSSRRFRGPSAGG